MMRNDIPHTALVATARILRPLIKLLLRYGIGYAAFTDLAKRIYFEVAKTDFAIPGKKQTTSRISTMTGLSRKEVARLESLPKSDELNLSGINRAARVISGWVRDKDFHDASNQPADLIFEGEQQSFTELVKRYSGDITARTIADELVRTGAISLTPTGLVHLESRAYVPNTSEIDKLAILGSDVSDLIATIEHNLTTENQPYLQRHVAYNYIPVDSIPALRYAITEVAQADLEAIDNILSKSAIQKDAAKPGGKYVRVGVGIYFFESKQS